MTTQQPKPPDGLSKNALSFWKSTMTSYSIRDESGLALLALVAESMTLREQALKAVRKDGAFFITRSGIRRPHPGIGVARDGAVTIARALRELNLSEGVEPDFRPQAIGGPRRARR